MLFVPQKAHSVRHITPRYNSVVDGIFTTFGGVLRLVGIALPLLLAAQNAPSNRPQQRQWKEYSFPNDGFALTLPERIDAHEDKTLSTAMFTAFTVTARYVYTVHLDQGLVLALHVVTFPGGCADFMSQVQSLIRGSKDGTADTAKMGIHLDPSERDSVILGRYPAVEGEREIETKTRSYGRTLCVGTKLFVFSTRWPSGSTKPAEISRVINSFRILKK
ncbi:MAG TPA: hypothetical protein VMH80_15305 [Bryobacteraceae bacterium]|nr:hypothetical protein [Bryobacteraceae bacterium]